MYPRVDHVVALEYRQNTFVYKNTHRLIASPSKVSTNASILSNIRSGIQILQHAATLLRDRPRRRQRNAIIHEAANAFVQMHPDMGKECFDVHFLTHRACPLLNDYLNGAMPYSPQPLADLWAAQFGVNEDMNAELSRAAVHMATAFLNVLEQTVERYVQQTKPRFGELQNTQFAS